MANLWARILGSLGFSELIKLPGKSSFEQITRPDVGLMIEAFLRGTDEFFDPLAFNDFLHANLHNPDMKQLQEDLKRNAFVPGEAAEWPIVNREYLNALAQQLRKESS